MNLLFRKLCLKKLRGMVDPESIPEILGLRQKYTLNGTLQAPMHTHILTYTHSHLGQFFLANPPTGMFSVGVRKSKCTVTRSLEWTQDLGAVRRLHYTLHWGQVIDSWFKIIDIWPQQLNNHISLFNVTSEAPPVHTWSGIAKATTFLPFPWPVIGWNTPHVNND